MGRRVRRILFNLTSIRAARELRAGASRDQVSGEFGISLRNIERIEAEYGKLPDRLLAGIERLLDERKKLRRLVSSLMHRGELRP
jgi:hypothetical protein